MESLDEIKRYIEAMDFRAIIRKLMEEKKWSKQQALTACEQYKNFVFLVRKYEATYSNLPPSNDIDEVWHRHILETVNYAKDCQVIFGKFLHHMTAGADANAATFAEEEKNFEITQELYFKEFNDYIYEIKPKNFNPIALLIEKISQFFTIFKKQPSKGYI